MKLTVELPKPLFKAGDKYVTEYGYEATIVSNAELETEDYTVFGKLDKIVFEYYYSVLIDIGGNAKIYYLSETDIEKSMERV